MASLTSLDLQYRRRRRAQRADRKRRWNVPQCEEVSQQATLRDVQVRDVTNDGVADLVSTSINDDSVRIFAGNVDGTFKAGISYSTGDYAATIRVFDSNGDGLLDIAAGNLFGSTMTVLVNNGDGSYQLEDPTTPAAEQTTSLSRMLITTV